MKISTKKIISILLLLLCENAITESALKIKNGIVTGYKGREQHTDKTLQPPPQVIVIGRQAFEENLYLKNVDLSNCKLLQLIDYGAFQRCGLLENIEFPKNIEVIGAFSFNYCKSLLCIDLSNCERLTLIDEYAFNKCEHLQTLKLPKTIKRIGNRAFYRCNNLKEIDLSHCKNLEYIGEKTFDFSRASLYEKPSNVVIKLPINIITICENSFGSRDYCSKLFIPKDAKELYQKIIKSGFPKDRIREY